jgi:tRNA U34 5-carboxymethylaminomethyl modifying GTPase MnmE/TrmE
LLTPRGVGGVAVVAVRGPRRRAAVLEVLRTRTGAPLALPAAPLPKLGWLWLDGEPVDEALVVERAASIEMHLHGAEAVLSALERRVGRLARPRASPADRLLREALSRPQIELALEQRAQPFGRFLAALAKLPPERRLVEARAALARTRVARALAEPCRLVLCGAQNAGKSTLMNRLLCDDRVLTGDQPGLTRDPVRERAALAGHPYLLVDTAGEGETTDDLDRQALERARRERAGALKLLVVDGACGPGPLERRLHDARTLIVRTKADLPQAPWPAALEPSVAVAALDPASAATVREIVGLALRRLRRLPEPGAVGGPAALDAAQEARLRAALADVAPPAP